jgi:hypothetical protein
MMSIVLAVAMLATAADPSKPHEHHGKLKPYPRPPPALKLSDAERATLDSGKAVMRQTEGEGGGRGMAIFKVNANPDIAWATIQDFPSYPKWIDEVKKCEIYKKDGGKIDVDFVIKSFPVTIEYYIHHDYDLANRWGTWTLDYNRNSDLDDSVGFWRVNAVDGNPNQSIVEYSVDIAIKGWVPGFVRDILVDKGLKQATSWVKVQSEKKQQSASAR